VIDTHWAEASPLVNTIEALAEDAAFPARELAAAVASKVRMLVRNARGVRAYR
jgi:hypothetical protein